MGAFDSGFDNGFDIGDIPPVELTLYFTDTVNNNWTNPDNWWLDADFTIPANTVPTEDDTAIITADIDTIIHDPAVANIIYWFANLNSGLTTYANYNYINDATIDGTLNGDSTFYNSILDGIVYGDVIFHNTNGTGQVLNTGTGDEKGNARIYHPSDKPTGITADGTIVYIGYPDGDYRTYYKINLIVGSNF